jgi:hypothetical protein
MTLYPPPPQTFKLWQFDHFDLSSQNAPITYFILFLKKYKKRKRKRNMLGWFGHLSIFLFFFSKKIKYVIGAFWEKKKKVKVVELSQFESLGG